MRRSWAILVCILSIFVAKPAWAAPFSVSKNQIDLVVAPGFNHVPVEVGLSSTNSSFAPKATTAVSDCTWVTPEIDSMSNRLVLNFKTSSLVASYTATITLTNGTNSQNVFVSAGITPLSVFRFISDPYRSVVYGIHQNGIKNGAVIVYDPYGFTSSKCITVGKKPSDLAISNDGNELYVLNSADPSIDVIDLNRQQIKENIYLTDYTNWGANDTFGNIATGPGSTLYYSDGAWAPVLHVLNRNTQKILQTISDSTNYINGCGGLGFSPDKSTLITWAQYGWSAGWGGCFLSKYSVDASGLLTVVKSGSSSLYSSLSRDPLKAPVLSNYDGSRYFVKQWVINPAKIDTPVQTFPGPVYSITPGGEVAVTGSAIIQTESGNKLYDLPFATTVQTVTQDYSRLVLFNATTRVIQSIDLIDAVGQTALGLSITPANKSITIAPTKLEWFPSTFVTAYQVYLSSSAEELESATTSSPAYLGQSNAPYIALSTALTPGTTYYWRADSVRSQGVTKGTVYSFTVSTVTTSTSQIQATTVKGFAHYKVSVTLSSGSNAVSWQASADQPWVKFVKNSGTTPDQLQVELDASGLAVGYHTANISLQAGSGQPFLLPVTLRVDPLKVTLLKTHPLNNLVYAISEDTATTGATAYLLEIDAESESILRAVSVGNSVTDLAIHTGDGRLYVTNWQTGYLLALDIKTLETVRTYAFKPFTSVGYADGDVYRVSAGAAGRLVWEEYDQGISISVFNTTTGTSSGTAFVREGGGGFDPTGRYYYHGDNNSSGAQIYKYDVTGDAFTQLATIRVQSYSYYGSRTVVVSGSGNGVFWNGSYFDANLKELWTMGVETYSCSADAKYAIGSSAIYDTQLRRQILGLPVTTKVSAFNSGVHKLVIQEGNHLGFYAISTPLTLPAPALTSGTVSETSVVLNWTDKSLETGFTIQQKKDGSDVWETALVTGQNTTSGTVSSLQSNTKYTFRIQANATDVSSDWSNTLSITTLMGPPTTPVLSTPVYSAGGINLAWSDSDSETGYVIERYSGGAWTVIGTTTAGVLNFRDTNVSNASVYYYRVKAVRDTTSSAYSATVSITTPPPPPPAPSAPPFVISSPNSSSAIAIYWMQVSNATSYIVERNSATGWVRLATRTSLENYYTDSGLPAGSWFQYRIRAVNAGGESLPSSTTLTCTYTQLDYWRLNNFGSTSGDGEASLDYTGPDGVSNLLKFASNLGAGEAYSLRDGGDRGTPVVSIDPETRRLTVDFVRRKSSSTPGITYVVEYSSDMVHWETSGIQTDVEPIDDESERATYTDTVSTSEVPVRFARVRVVEQP